MGPAVVAAPDEAAIVQVACTKGELIWLLAGVPEGAGETRFARRAAMVGVLVAALVLGLLPAAVGLTILLGTVPPGFGAGASLAILAGIKIGAVAAAIAAMTRAQLRVKPAPGFD